MRRIAAIWMLGGIIVMVRMSWEVWLQVKGLEVYLSGGGPAPAMKELEIGAGRVMDSLMSVGSSQTPSFVSTRVLV